MHRTTVHFWGNTSVFVTTGTRFAVLREVCSSMDKIQVMEEKSLQSCIDQKWEWL